VPRLSEETWIPVVIGRDDFARNYWDYEPGEHVLFAGPTQLAGKTTLAFQLLEYTATPECPAYIAVSKPRDPVTAKEMKRLNYRLVTDWPPPPKLQHMFTDKPAGFVIWPEFGDINKDIPNAATVTKRLLDDRYAKGVKGKKGILVMDDTVVKSKLLGLDREMTTHIAMAGAMDLGGWYFVQKPTDSGRASVWSYGNAAHIFLSREPDRRNRIRYDEIGGFESHQIAEIVRQLGSFQFLYIQRKGSRMCVVDKD
jgi:hypothetical protein